MCRGGGTPYGYVSGISALASLESPLHKGPSGLISQEFRKPVPLSWKGAQLYPWLAVLQEAIVCLESRSFYGVLTELYISQRVFKASLQPAKKDSQILGLKGLYLVEWRW